ncbi:MAG: hypothetical protein CM15mV3_1210 [Caudoviricetes sp.]|nr:MAG: hypothetical protein CM15mV3_1210 [Caudoviricetes sp.]
MSGDYETYEWHETPMENSVSRRNALERGLAIVRMVRRSSQDSRGKLSLKEHRSISKASLQIGQTAAHLTRMTGLLEENYETN